MRDDSGPTGRLGWAVTAAAVGILVAASAPAQSLQGWVQVQYDNSRRTLPVDRQESWLKSFEVNYATRLRQTTELVSQVRFSDLSYTGRPDRYRRPEGMVRLAHPVFGVMASYRPERVTDSRDQTIEQQTLQLTGYLQKAKLPQLSGSWLRSHRDTNVYGAGTASETREVSANYDRGILNLHANYGDQVGENDRFGTRTRTEDHVTLGSTLRVRRRRSNATLQYDFSQIRSAPGSALGQTSRVHTATLNGARQFSKRTSGSLSYNYRRVGALEAGVAPANEHNGSLNVAHAVSTSLQFSGGGGVRNALLNGRQETERYLVGTVAANRQVRPGWRATAGGSHSWNWLPGEAARVVDALNTSTQMRLARGLDLSGDLGITSSGLPEARRDTLGASRLVGLQTGVALRATPLRPITVNASLRHYGSGSSLGGDGVSSNSYRVATSWNPSAFVQATGTWGKTNVSNSRAASQTSWLATLQWNPTRRLQMAGNYTRSVQPDAPGTGISGPKRETIGGRMVLALSENLVSTVQYSEADPGLPTHRHQVTVIVTQGFRR